MKAAPEEDEDCLADDDEAVVAPFTLFAADPPIPPPLPPPTASLKLLVAIKLMPLPEPREGEGDRGVLPSPRLGEEGARPNSPDDASAAKPERNWSSRPLTRDCSKAMSSSCWQIVSSASASA